jgi:FkbM family methyltransferase
LLYKKGWNGINFDISKYSIELFNFHRKRDLNINCGISNKSGVRKKYFRKEINMLNTMNKKIAKIHFRNGFQTENIRTNTLNFFLKKYHIKSKIDLLKIDVEGEELNVLKSINFNKYKPKLVSIEIHNSNNFYLDDNKYFKKERVYKYLIKRSYKLIWKNKYSFIFEY